MMNDEQAPEVQAEPESKKPYSSPGLIDYGSIARLTLGGMNLGNDGNVQCNGNANPTLGCES